MSKNLMPCPLCGGKAQFIEIEPHTHTYATFMPDCTGEAFIECTKCSCSIAANSVQEAVDMWNRRV